ncbi:MAG TPA: FAD binding domain-containing protein [Baekduia sp.]|nr:FAD binding domain-containing protein [Baekduia sp.]
MTTAIARTYVAPVTVDDVLAVLSEHPRRVVAGGTDLVVAARSGKAPLPTDLLAIHRVGGLDALAASAEGLRIGALVTHAALEASPEIRERYSALSDACALIGSHATRSFGTLGGNICNASPAAETPSPLIVLGAAAELRSSRGSREVPLGEIIVGPGRTILNGDELLTEVRVPRPPGRSGSAYVRLEYRRAMEIAVVGAAAFVALADDGTIASARVSLTAVGPRPLPVDAVAERLSGAVPDPDALAAAAELAVHAAQPIDDIRGSSAYRGAMVPVMTRRALERAVQRARSTQA